MSEPYWRWHFGSLKISDVTGSMFSAATKRRLDKKISSPASPPRWRREEEDFLWCVGKGLRDDFGGASVSVFGINALRGRRWDGDVRGGLSGPHYRWASAGPRLTFPLCSASSAEESFPSFTLNFLKGKKLRNAQLYIYIYICQKGNAYIISVR